MRENVVSMFKKRESSLSPDSISRYLLRTVYPAVESTSKKFMPLYYEGEEILIRLKTIYETPSLLLAFKSSGATHETIARACISLSGTESQHVLTLFDTYRSLSLIEARAKNLLSQQAEIIEMVAISLENGEIINPLNRIIDDNKALKQVRDKFIELKTLARNLAKKNRELARSIGSSSFLTFFQEEGKLFEDIEGIVASLGKDIKSGVPQETRRMKGVAALFAGFMLGVSLLAQGCVSIQGAGSSEYVTTQSGIQFHAGTIQEDGKNAQQLGIFGQRYNVPANQVKGDWDIIGTNKHVVDTNNLVKLDADGRYIHVVGFSAIYNANDERSAIADAERDALKTIVSLSEGEPTNKLPADACGRMTETFQIIKLMKKGSNGPSVIVHVLCRFPARQFEGIPNSLLPQIVKASSGAQAKVIRMFKTGVAE